MEWNIRIRFASRLPSTSIELVVAKPMQKLSTKQRRAMETPRTDVAEPEPLLLLWETSNVSAFSESCPEPVDEELGFPPGVRSEATCGKQEGGCSNQRGRAGGGRHSNPGLVVASSRSSQNGSSRRGREEGPARTPRGSARSQATHLLEDKDGKSEDHEKPNDKHE